MAPLAPHRQLWTQSRHMNQNVGMAYETIDRMFLRTDRAVFRACGGIGD
jgi:hypothetical protein